jgi:hypothetical protein
MKYKTQMAAPDRKTGETKIRSYQATKKEETDSLYQAHLSMMSEDITSKKGKEKMKKMLDARTTDSGRAKSGKGQNVKDIQHIGRANVDGLGGTPPNRKTAKNPIKSRHYGGTGNKAERRVEKMKTRKEETAYDYWKQFIS